MELLDSLRSLVSLDADFKWVFYGYSLTDLLLAAGRYIMLVTAALLVFRHGAWFARGRHRIERRVRRKAHIHVELAVAVVLAGTIAYQLGTSGATSDPSVAQAMVQVWALVALLVSMVLRQPDRPPR